MSYVTTLFLDHLGLFHTALGGLTVNGANLVTAQHLRGLCADERVARVEAFVPPAVMMRPELLRQAEEAALPEHRRGALVFHPYHAAQEAWADGEPRVMLCLDPTQMAVCRYLRDRFAAGPMPIVSLTHALGFHLQWSELAPFARAARVPFDSIACVSASYREAMRRTLTEFLGEGRAEPPCRLDLAPHGVDTALFTPAAPHQAARARRRLGLPAEGRIALYLGRVTPQGKADLLPLVRAFAQAAAPDRYLLIAGTQEMPGYADLLRQLADSLGVGDRLLLRPEVPPAARPAFFAASDLFVFPGDTYSEAQGITVLEAMASGLPVVASDWDGLRDMVADGETGYVVPAWWVPALERLGAFSPVNHVGSEFHAAAQCVWIDTAALADRLARLFESADLRRRMGAAGRERAEREFSQEATRTRWHTLCEELLAGAALESPSDAAARRAGAGRLGMPTPYHALFAHYGTYVAAPDTARLRVTPSGGDVLAGRYAPQVYPEPALLVHQETLTAVLTVAAAHENAAFGAVEREAATATGHPAEEIRFAIALLLKADHLAMSAM